MNEELGRLLNKLWQKVNLCLVVTLGLIVMSVKYSSACDDVGNIDFKETLKGLHSCTKTSSVPVDGFLLSSDRK